jgi:hypothetical protein
MDPSSPAGSAAVVLSGGLRVTILAVAMTPTALPGLG